MNTNTTRYTKYAAALAVATTAITSASAAIIAFEAPDLNTTPGEVSTNGTPVSAVNLVSHNSLVIGTTTVNGVDFVDTNLFSNGYAVSGLVNTGDSNLDTLVGTVGYNGPASVQLSGLTNGQQYELQIFIGDNRAGSSGRTLTVGDLSGGTGATYTYADGGTAQQATSIIGTFTAIGTTQDFTAVLGGGGTGTEFSAYQLRAVPEPSSTALLGLGGLALILRRRK